MCLHICMCISAYANVITCDLCNSAPSEPPSSCTRHFCVASGSCTSPGYGSKVRHDLLEISELKLHGATGFGPSTIQLEAVFDP